MRRGLGAPALLVALALVAAAAKPGPCQVVPWQALFQAASGPRWIDRAAQVQAESGFDPAACSSVGARGPAQFMPSTWREWGTGDPRDPRAAIPAQHRYMLWLEARVGGDLDQALGSYNAGLGSILKAKRLAQGLGLPGAQAWLTALPRVTGEAHARETRGYLAHNATFRAEIRARLGGKDA